MIPGMKIFEKSCVIDRKCTSVVILGIIVSNPDYKKEDIGMKDQTITEEMVFTFKEVLLNEERSTATIQKYIRDVTAFAAFVGTKVLNKEVVIQYKQVLIEKYAPASVNSMLAAVNRFLKEIGRHDCTVKSLRIQRQAFRCKERELSKAEYFRLLETAKKKNNNWLFMLMQTICSTGIRVSELQFITLEAAKTGSVVVSLKGKTRQVLIPAALCRELKQYAKLRGIHSGSIFVTKSGKALDRSNILHAMKALCKDAGVEERKVFPHNLRHLFACLYYKASRDISRLADLLGHSSINTTRIYTSVSGSEQQRQIERLGLIIKNTA